MARQPDRAAKPGSKIESVIALLTRAEGASLAEIIKATGWQPHSARTVLTGLKKKGHTVTREKIDGVSRYRITKANAS